MLNPVTLARPYARAAFDAARQSDAVARWSQALVLACAAAGDEKIGPLISDPRLEDAQVLELFSAAGGDGFDEPFENFLRVLQRYKRLELLPEIAAQFELLRAASEQRIKVRVASAIALDDEQQTSLRQRLAKRFGREIELENEIDPELISGLVIHAGDQVIDGSVRGRLSRLALSISE